MKKFNYSIPRSTKFSIGLLIILSIVLYSLGILDFVALFIGLILILALFKMNRNRTLLIGPESIKYCGKIFYYRDFSSLNYSKDTIQFTINGKTYFIRRRDHIVDFDEIVSNIRAF